jgi:geranylgeranyl pyrophosphate synthase
MRVDSAMLMRLGPFVTDVEAVMVGELRHWPWDAVGPMRGIIEGQIRGGGKRMRPLVALATAEAHGADPGRAVSAAASVELYHTAALVLDDVQDNSEVRRGDRAVHVTASMSTAINVAALVRSLSYHVLHRDPALRPELTAVLHHELDTAATRLVLGQSVDIGWNDGWYPDYEDYPYRRMVEWKTGSLFGCAAAMGAIVGGAPQDAVDEARQAGVTFGVLYQIANDFLDVFGGDREQGRPRFEDLRGGKLSAPVIRLLESMSLADQTARRDWVLRRVKARRAVGPGDWDRLTALMDQHGVAERLRVEMAALAAELARPATAAFGDLVEAVLAPTRRDA